MVPSAGIVAGPGGGVTVTAGVTGAGHDEGSAVRRELEQAFECATGVLHSEDVVDLEVIGGAGSKPRLFDAVLGVVGHGFGGDFEDRGLVHVIPEASDAAAD